MKRYKNVGETDIVFPNVGTIVAGQVIETEADLIHESLVDLSEDKKPDEPTTEKSAADAPAEDAS